MKKMRTKKEQKDLNVESTKYTGLKWVETDSIILKYSTIKESFKAGANWQKQYDSREPLEQPKKLTFSEQMRKVLRMQG